jgi:hypothetical protein
MIKIMGLDKLTRQLEDAKKALGAIDGTIGEVKYDPHDPASIEAAIAESSRLIDIRVGPYATNPIVAPLVAQAKEHFRNRIIERAAARRLKGSEGDE